MYNYYHNSNTLLFHHYHYHRNNNLLYITNIVYFLHLYKEHNLHRIKYMYHYQDNIRQYIVYMR